MTNPDPNKAPGHSAFSHEEMTREKTSPLLLESEEWPGTWALQPHGEGLCWVPALSQPGSRPCLYLHAEQGCARSPAYARCGHAELEEESFP